MHVSRGPHAAMGSLMWSFAAFLPIYTMSDFRLAQPCAGVNDFAVGAMLDLLVKCPSDRYAEALRSVQPRVGNG